MESDYTSAVLNGLRKHGVSSARVCQITGLSAVQLRHVINGKATLQDRHLKQIEQETGLTAGQLAATSDPVAKKALGPLMDAWAEVLEDTQAGRVAETA